MVSQEDSQKAELFYQLLVRLEGEMKLVLTYNYDAVF